MPATAYSANQQPSSHHFGTSRARATVGSIRTEPLHPCATTGVLVVGALVLIAHLIASLLGTGYWFDEAYMLAIGRDHLDWGSADQPPMAPFLAWLMDTIAPGSVIALRIPVILSTAMAVPVAALIAREFGGDRRAQVMTAVAQATCLWISLTGHWLTPYGLEPLQWLVLIWLLVRWVRTRDDRLLLALGVVAGVAAQTKFQIFLLCAVLLLSILVAGPRSLLRRPALWVGVLIAGVIAAPTLIWQALHGWPQLKMGSIAAAESFLYGGRPGIAVLLLVLTGAVGVVLLVLGLIALFRMRELTDLRFLAISFVVLYLFFVIAPGRVYYLSGLYAPIFAAGAMWLQRRRERGRTGAGWVRWVAYPVTAVLAGVAVATSVPSVDESVPMTITQRAANGYQTLAPAEQQRAVLMGQSYIVATYLDVYGDRFGLPSAHSPNRGYGYFDPPQEHRDIVVFVGSDPKQLRPWFDSVEQVSDNINDTKVWICTGPRESWAVMWPELRNLQLG